MANELLGIQLSRHTLIVRLDFLPKAISSGTHVNSLLLRDVRVQCMTAVCTCQYCCIGDLLRFSLHNKFVDCNLIHFQQLAGGINYLGKYTKKANHISRVTVLNFSRNFHHPTPYLHDDFLL
jgi:hypothetical protein